MKMREKIDDLFYEHESLAICCMLIGALVLVAALVCVCWLASLPVCHLECANTADVMDVSYEWRVFGGCFLELDGQMLPKDRWYYIKFGVPVE